MMGKQFPVAKGTSQRGAHCEMWAAQSPAFPISVHEEGLSGELFYQFVIVSKSEQMLLKIIMKK